MPTVAKPDEIAPTLDNKTMPIKKTAESKVSLDADAVPLGSALGSSDWRLLSPPLLQPLPCCLLCRLICIFCPRASWSGDDAHRGQAR